MIKTLQTPDLTIVEDFLDKPWDARHLGLRAKYVDMLGKDGEIYKRVCECNVPGVQERLDEAMGRPVSLLGMGYRLNFGGELPNNAVHSDLGWGTYAAVIYLSEPEAPERSGTAFWQHHSGPDRVRAGELDVLRNVEADWNTPEAWHLTQFVPAKFNTAIIYRGERFHSRWPFEAHGVGPEDGRLIIVAFFN